MPSFHPPCTPRPHGNLAEILPDEAVETAARALLEVEYGPGEGWDTTGIAEREFYTSSARAALTAAAPHIEAAVRADERERVARRIEAAIQLGSAENRAADMKSAVEIAAEIAAKVGRVQGMKSAARIARQETPHE